MAKKYQTLLKETAGQDFPNKDRDFNLDTRVVVYVPSTRFATAIPDGEFQSRIKKTQAYLSDLFGGTTKVAGIGTYRAKDGRLIGENVAKVESFIKYENYTKKDNTLKQWILDRKTEWQQEQIAYEFESPRQPESRIYFI